MFYQYHVFFCTNQRTDGRGCCQDHQAAAVRQYAKARVKALGLDVPGGVRINTAGCLNRCALGPVMVVYPQGVWYRYSKRSDVDEIIEQHLQQGRIVKHLQI